MHAQPATAKGWPCGVGGEGAASQRGAGWAADRSHGLLHASQACLTADGCGCLTVAFVPRPCIGKLPNSPAPSAASPDVGTAAGWSQAAPGTFRFIPMLQRGSCAITEQPGLLGWAATVEGAPSCRLATCRQAGDRASSVLYCALAAAAERPLT